MGAENIDEEQVRFKGTFYLGHSVYFFHVCDLYSFLFFHLYALSIYEKLNHDEKQKNKIMRKNVELIKQKVKTHRNGCENNPKWREGAIVRDALIKLVTLSQILIGVLHR